MANGGTGAGSQPPPTKSACTGGEEEELGSEEEDELGLDGAMPVRPRGGSEAEEVGEDSSSRRRKAVEALFYRPVLPNNSHARALRCPAHIPAVW
jgi:hypothetical protein